jgi:hypothetical protein
MGSLRLSCRWRLLCLLLNFTFRLMSQRFRGSPWAVRQLPASAPAKIAIRRSDRLALAIVRSSSRRSPVILPTVPFYSNLCIAALRNRPRAAARKERLIPTLAVQLLDVSRHELGFRLPPRSVSVCSRSRKAMHRKISSRRGASHRRRSTPIFCFLTAAPPRHRRFASLGRRSVLEWN